MVWKAFSTFVASSAEVSIKDREFSTVGNKEKRVDQYHIVIPTK